MLRVSIYLHDEYVCFSPFENEISRSITSINSPLIFACTVLTTGGANMSYPRRQLFTRLKHDFFRHSHRIALATVPVSVLLGEGRMALRERLLELPDLFHALYPPTLEVIITADCNLYW